MSRSEQRLEDLEIKVAFVEKLVMDLDEVVQQLAGTLYDLRDEVVTLRAQVTEDSDQQASLSEIEVPPHY